MKHEGEPEDLHTIDAEVRHNEIYPLSASDALSMVFVALSLAVVAQDPKEKFRVPPTTTTAFS